MKNDCCTACKENERRINELQQELLKCQRKIEELIDHPTLVAGLTGETLIASFVKGKLSDKGASYDFELINGDRVEIKLSKLNIPMKGYPTLRWTWDRVLTSDGGCAKDYKYLILIGEKDERYQSFEEDKSNFVFFLITKEEAKEFSAPKDLSGHINLTTNSKTQRTNIGKKMWKKRKAPQEIYKLLNNCKSS